MTQDEWEDTIHRRLGKPSGDDFPADLLVESVNAALREYGKFRGPQVLLTLDATADEPLYVLPDDVLLVLDVFWNLSTGEAGLFDPMRVLVQDVEGSGMGGGSVLFNPSLLTAFYSRLESFHDHFEGAWEVVPGPTGAGANVWLDPPPTTTGEKVYVLCRKTMPITQVLIADEEAFVHAALWKAYEMRAGALLPVSSASIGGGSWTFGGKNLVDMADRMKKTFQNMMPQAAGIHR